MKPKQFWAMVDVRGEDECWLWEGNLDKRGYGRFSNRQATHLALEIDGRPRPAGLFALHGCDNPPCCNPKHLRWGTHGENMAEAAERGLMNRWRGRRAGARNPNARLTIGQVHAIRRDLAGGESARSISKRMAISYSTIGDIRHGRTWK